MTLSRSVQNWEYITFYNQEEIKNGGHKCKPNTGMSPVRSEEVFMLIKVLGFMTMEPFSHLNV